MSHLFSDNIVPVQLDPVRDNFNVETLEKGMWALQYQKGTPGYKAVAEPKTPVDKAFQIYTILLCHFNNYKHEVWDHNTKWSHRDAAWTAAADWLIETQPAYKVLAKKETRELRKILPDALRAQCSLELPPGPWETFPKDTQKKTKPVDQAMDTLQKMGLNIKIHGMAILDGEPPKSDRAILQNYGTLVNMQESIESTRKPLPTENLSLF